MKHIISSERRSVYLDNVGLKTRFMIHLSLVGDDFDTEYVTQHIKIKPESIRHKSDQLKNGRLFGHTEWNSRTSWIESCNLAEVLINFFDFFKPRISSMAELPVTINAHWNLLIGLEIYDVKPILILPSEIIKIASSLGAEIGFDVYDYSI